MAYLIIAWTWSTCTCEAIELAASLIFTPDSTNEKLFAYQIRLLDNHCILWFMQLFHHCLQQPLYYLIWSANHGSYPIGISNFFTYR